MASESTPDNSWKARFLRFWHTEDSRTAIIRDVAVAALIVLVLLGGIWIYAGQPLTQAPVVSVESGSMMHGPFSGQGTSGYGNPPFGRVGTIDPGDIVFVKKVHSASEVEVAFGTGKRGGYGGHGDVIIFKPYGNSQTTRIIHRAMLYVEAVPEGCTPEVNCVFKIPAFCNNPHLADWAPGQNLEKYCAGSPDQLTVDLHRDGLFLSISDSNGGPFPCRGHASCQPFYSSFITKGDNNGAADFQVSNQISPPVRLDWIIGKARGEIPWFGLIKLALYGNTAYDPRTDPTHGSNWHVLAARAPSDIWWCLFLSLAILIAIPMVIDVMANRRTRRQEGERPPSPPQ